jgi:hypothetical protein
MTDDERELMSRRTPPKVPVREFEAEETTGVHQRVKELSASYTALSGQVSDVANDVADVRAMAARTEGKVDGLEGKIDGVALAVQSITTIHTESVVQNIRVAGGRRELGLKFWALFLTAGGAIVEALHRLVGC